MPTDEDERLLHQVSANLVSDIYFKQAVFLTEPSEERLTCGDEHDEMVAAEEALREVDPEMSEILRADHWALAHWSTDTVHVTPGPASASILLG